MSETFDLLVKGGVVVSGGQARVMDIGVRSGVICALEDELASEGAEELLQADGMVVMPGMIDVHTHFNEPGFAHWEGFASGSASLAAGGVTTYIDMPLNGVPPTVNADILMRKGELGERESIVDFLLWGGLVPGNGEHLTSLAAGGVAGFKAFMSAPASTGEDEFRNVEALELFNGMKEIAKTGKILALHAEKQELLGPLYELNYAYGSARAYSESRPPICELDAVGQALLMAELTGCRLHFVHISTAEACDMIMRARERGIDATLETCPHYLVLSEEDLARLGAVAKCAPPLRSSSERERLWDALAAGKIDMISSDHSPCPIEMKRKDNMFDAWGGISGCQFSLELMLDHGHIRRGLPLSRIAEWTAENPAKRFGLFPRKGVIALGGDADLAIIDLKHKRSISAEEIAYKHKHSPYVGMEVQSRVMASVSRGRVVYRQSTGVEREARGKWIKV
ncbi:allantoinase AllB [Paenibacillus sp. HB172176]|uniref:allantoinase AllB n=1 Tax=Paenibacillus sp. HB172176 TaxID=2493690 RepID=UPI00143AD498|nr:allantoinase AllB [Paenibacillus sp. HB172176]